MKHCIYCREQQEDQEFTLEHVIPQFLGGAQAPDNLKTRDVCKRCNNNLGLFVDAGFEKDFLVYNQLHKAAYSFFNPQQPTSLPLQYMGVSLDLHPPEIKDDEVCEYWIGPLGEQIFWIRPSDERMSWYAGGNPRTTKKKKTKAYFLFSIHSHKEPKISILAFQNSFSGRKVTKISCTTINDVKPTDIGFSEPDELDRRRIDYFSSKASNGEWRNNNVKLSVDYDLRFMAKLAIGLNYVLFGHQVLESSYSKELYKALWYKNGEEKPQATLRKNHNAENEMLRQEFGIKNGVTIAISMANQEDIILSLNLNQEMHWVMICAKKSELGKTIRDEVQKGLCIVLFKSLQKGISLSFPELIAHNNNSRINLELKQIEDLVVDNGDYLKNLKTSNA